MKARNIFEAMNKGRLLDLMPSASEVWTGLITYQAPEDELLEDFDMFVARSQDELKNQIGEGGEDLPNDPLWDYAKVKRHEVILHEPFVWVAVIATALHHFVYAAATEDELYPALVQYCGENWPGGDRQPMPQNPRERVSMYFTLLDGEEALSIERYDMPPA